MLIWIIASIVPVVIIAICLLAGPVMAMKDIAKEEEEDD